MLVAVARTVTVRMDLEKNIDMGRLCVIACRVRRNRRHLPHATLAQKATWRCSPFIVALCYTL
jgi:hypothetical protein